MYGSCCFKSLGEIWNSIGICHKVCPLSVFDYIAEVYCLIVACKDVYLRTNCLQCILKYFPGCYGICPRETQTGYAALDTDLRIYTIHGEIHLKCADTSQNTNTHTHLPSSIVLVKLTIREVIPLKHPATTKSFGSFVKDVIFKTTM